MARMELDEGAVQRSLASQCAVLELCGTRVAESSAAVSLASTCRRDSGFFAATMARPGAAVGDVLAQAYEAADVVGRPFFIWAADGSELALACWQAGLERASSSAMMARPADLGVPPQTTARPDVDVIEVVDHESADLFRRVHVDQFRGADAPVEVVAHFASDRVLMDDSVRAVVAVIDGVAASAGYLHRGESADGIYWVYTVPDHRGAGLAGALVDALVARSDTAIPVVLQATRAGRPVYLRHGFEDYGLLDAWRVDPTR